MKKIIKNIDKKLLLTTLILFTFGLIMIFSASSVTAYMRDASPSIYFIRQFLFLVVCFGFCLFIVIKIPTKKYKYWSWIALVIVTGLIVVTLAYSVAVNGVNGWIGIGRLGIQPSEFAKVIIIIWLACMLGNINEKSLKDQWGTIGFCIMVVALITFLVIMQQDYGTAMIFLIISVILFFLSSADKTIKSKLFLLGGGTVLVIALVLLVTGGKIIPSDKLERFNFFNPCERYLTTGNQVCNGYIAINNGGLFGKGLGDSTQKYLYLPEAYTDFIFAIIVEELGFTGAIGLFLLYLFLLLRLGLAGKKTSNNSNALICYGVLSYITLHIIINLGGVTGILPLTGVPLPFMSYGGSFACSILFALTIIQRINYESNIENLKKN